MTEILAPAGDENSAYAAINAGADAVYLGLNSFSARSSAANFDYSALQNLIARAHLFGVKIYVAMNTLVKDVELSDFVKAAAEVHNMGADALIIQDIFLGAYLKKTYPQMCLHLSTQAGICNTYGAKYAKELGFSRVILARETRLADIKEIAKIIETEVFVQGALCTCFSGQCYLSSFAGGNSGNRGKCKQPCRKKYKIDRKGYEEYAYRISLSDLSVGEDMNILAEAGVFSFKIEGRMRRPEYVSAAVNYCKKTLEGGDAKGELSALKRTYNRGNYTKGLSFGQDKSLISSAVQGHIGEYAGVVFVESGKYVCRSSARCGKGDGFKILRGGAELCGAAFGESVKGGFTLKSSTRLKNGDKVFVTTDARLNEKLLSVKRTQKLRLSANISVGKAPQVTVNGKVFTADFIAERAQGRPVTKENIINCFNKTDAYPFETVYENILIDSDVFIPVSQLNAFRRTVYAQILEDNGRNGRATIDIIYPLPQPQKTEKCGKTAVLARTLCGLKCDVGILKPDDCSADISPLVKSFSGEKFLYLPPFLTGEEIGRIKPVINAFDGIYCGGNYAVLLAKEMNKKLFAGVGFNIFNHIAVDDCPADYIAVSKELTAAEAKPLARANTFYITAGDIKVMDLIYCPFSKTCGECDKRDIYTLTDENGRAFPLRRYKTEECRFELFNCAPLVSSNGFTGELYDLTAHENPAKALANFGDAEKLKKYYVNYTKGHTENGVL